MASVQPQVACVISMLVTVHESGAKDARLPDRGIATCICRRCPHLEGDDVEEQLLEAVAAFPQLWRQGGRSRFRLLAAQPQVLAQHREVAGAAARGATAQSMSCKETCDRRQLMLLTCPQDAVAQHILVATHLKCRRPTWLAKHARAVDPFRAAVHVWWSLACRPTATRGLKTDDRDYTLNAVVVNHQLSNPGVLTDGSPARRQYVHYTQFIVHSRARKKVSC